MQCPHCGHGKHKVIDTRERGETIRRRRQCLDCEQRFTTYEHVAPGLLVSKRDGHREPFDPQKLLAGIRIAAVKRPVSSERMKSIANYTSKIEFNAWGAQRSQAKRSAISCWINWPMSIRWPISVSPASISILAI